MVESFHVGLTPRRSPRPPRRSPTTRYNGRPWRPLARRLQEGTPMKIAVVGTGYVGLVTATCLAESGNDVIGIDKDERKIAVLESGKLPIYEPGLLELVQRNRREGRLRFTTDLTLGITPAPLIFIAVGTPQAA